VNFAISSANIDHVLRSRLAYTVMARCVGVRTCSSVVRLSVTWLKGTSYWRRSPVDARKSRPYRLRP